MNHSIVDGVGLAIDTPEGMLVHSGDFRIDTTPVDAQYTDLIRFAHFGEKGVLAFFSDSTNAEKEGFTLSESAVRKTLEDLFQACRGRIIVASFASNISRIQQVIDLAVKFDRKVVLNGKSMVTNVGIARQEGFINMPEDTEITVNARSTSFLMKPLPLSPPEARENPCPPWPGWPGGSTKASR